MSLGYAGFLHRWECRTAAARMVAVAGDSWIPPLREWRVAAPRRIVDFVGICRIPHPRECWAAAPRRMVDIAGLSRIPAFAGMAGCGPCAVWLPLPGIPGFPRKREWRVAVLAPYGCRCRGFLDSRIRGNGGLRSLRRMADVAGLCRISDLAMMPPPRYAGAAPLALRCSWRTATSADLKSLKGV